MLNESQILHALRTVHDLELGANIVDMGLITRLRISPQKVEVDMTTTSPSCPMSSMMVEEVRQALTVALPKGCRIDVRVVHEPPWTPARMSASLRAHLGW